MSKDDLISFSGKITNKFPAGRFEVTLENGHLVHAVISGKIRKNNIMIYVGDSVEVEVSPYDLSKGRIVYRHKD